MVSNQKVGDKDPPSVDTEPPSILVVDDNPLIVTVLKGLFASEAYHVCIANNGQEALGVLDKKYVDLIVCDVMMPVMDGYELHQAVRKNPEFSHIPFVFLTALSETSDINQGKELGADDYVVKPFDPRDLLAIVKGKIARARSLKNASNERYDSYRKRVVHVLSHEFRTPLVAINTGSEILLDNKGKLDSTKVTNLLEAIHRGGQRLERLVTDFMLLQQIEAGIAQKMFESRSAACNAAALVEQFVDSHAEEALASGFTLSFESMSPQAHVQIYEPQVLDILERLLSNAKKFKSSDLRIDFVLYSQDGEVVIEVRDHGIGMNVQRVREAIDLFGQIDRDKLEQQGGGLGLAIASRYAAINQGHLDFETRKDGGTTVYLVLPKKS
jgi:two-component system sensor histidine kinase/response regulator